MRDRLPPPGAVEKNSERALAPMRNNARQTTILKCGGSGCHGRSTRLRRYPVRARLKPAHGCRRSCRKRRSAARRRREKSGPAQVRTLLDQHADVNVRSEDGSTALLWAAHWNDLQTAELLVRAGADANAANDFRMTPLSQACTNGSARVRRRASESRRNPDTPIATGETPLMTCARAGNADAVRDAARSWRRREREGATQNQTALMWAAAEQHPQVLQTLIEARADLQAHTKTGIYRAALCRAGRRHGDRRSAAGRRRRREHPIAARA